MAATAITVPGSYNTVRYSLPEKDVPPFATGVNIWTAAKYNATTGVVVNPWNDPSTDYTVVGTALKPDLITGSTAMGSKQIMKWINVPSARLLLKNTLYIPINKFTLSFCYTVDGVSGGSGNRCLFSFIDKLASKYFCIYGTTTSAGPPRITTGFGSIIELGTQTATPVTYDITYSSLAANRKEVLTVAYDGTVTGGTFYAYWNGVLVNTFTNVGQFTLEGSSYLGADLRSSTLTSDFKGELGCFMIEEKLRPASEVLANYTYLSTAFS